MLRAPATHSYWGVIIIAQEAGIDGLFIAKVEELCCSSGYWDIQANRAVSLPFPGGAVVLFRA